MKKTIFYSRKIITGLILIVFCYNTFSQSTKIDSLLLIIKKLKNDTTKVNTINTLAREFIKINPDTAIFFGKIGLNLAFKEDYKKGIADCYFNIGDIFYAQSNYDSSTEYYIKASDILTRIGDKKGMIRCYSNIGGNFYDQGIYIKAIEYALRSLKISDELGDIDGMARCNNNIGILYEEQRNNEKAIEYYINSLKIYEKLNNKNGIAACFINIGNVYMNKSAFDKSMEYFNKALKMHEITGDKKGISKCYNNIGLIFYQQKKYKTALDYYFKTLKIDKELEDKNGISRVLINIARINIKLKKYNEAVEYSFQSLSFADETGSLRHKNEAYMFLSIAFDSLKNYQKSLEYHKLFKQINDKLTNLENRKHTTEIEAVYQNDKKKKDIELLEKDKKLKTTEIRRQILQKYTFIGGFVLMLALAFISYRSFRLKKKANIIISEKNKELNQQNEEIRTQRDEIEKQKQQIEIIHEELNDSIHYAERIQGAILPNDDFLKKIMPEYFVLFKPHSIVSGDFYWAAKINNQLIVCVADCTGHGVPGAFMSMLGISFLNEIILKKEVTKASEILDKLRTSVIDALKQNVQSGEQNTSTDSSTSSEQRLSVKDGMDLALVVLNIETLEMHFAGANNPCYVIVRNEVTKQSQADDTKDCFTEARNDEYRLIELKGDKMPIGIHDRMNPFTNQIYQLQKDDTIYLMSDGYEDQFGGSQAAKGGKKFKSKQLKELLTANSQKSMTEQKEILNKTLIEWKGNLPQIDDICILGIRI